MGLRGGVRQYVAQGTPQIDTEIGKKNIYGWKLLIAPEHGDSNTGEKNSGPKGLETIIRHVEKIL